MEFALSVEVARKDGEIVHLALPSGSKVSDLRHVLAARLNKPGVDFVFSFNGRKLKDEDALSEVGIHPGSRVDVEEVEQSIRTLLSPDDFSRGLLVQNLPAADPQVTEDKLVEHFGAFGQITRIIIQQEESQNKQHAVVIYRSPPDLRAAVEAGEHRVLGTRTVVRALDQIEELAERGPSRYAEFLGRLLARGYSLGQQGLMRVSELDKQHGISQRTMERVRGIDEQWSITDRVMSLTDSLEKRLHISEVAQQTQEFAARTLENSMQNPYIAAGVQKATSILESAKAFGMEALGSAQKEIEREQALHEALDPALLPPPPSEGESKQEM